MSKVGYFQANDNINISVSVLKFHLKLTRVMRLFPWKQSLITMNKQKSGKIQYHTFIS